MRRLLTFILLIATATLSAAQTPGTVQITPGKPPSAAVAAQMVATSGTVTCTVVGDTFPATALTVTCALGGQAPWTYKPPLVNGSAITFGVNLNLDGVTFQFRMDDRGVITAQATANSTVQTLTF